MVSGADENLVIYFMWPNHNDIFAHEHTTHPFVQLNTLAVDTQKEAQAVTE